MKQLSLIVLVFAVFALSGCAAVPYQGGGLYSSYERPYSTTQNAVGTQSGQSCMTNILGILATGDASISSAAESGGINEVATVDTDFSSILGLYSTTCTTVTGQ